ncbi:hypothetical protein MRB53_036669 [Persea americana]|nr:hypothetical protein MRB53_036669 [Persea americana]
MRKTQKAVIYGRGEIPPNSLLIFALPDYAIGRVLVQEGHPVAYESRKLNETERRGPRERDDSSGALPEDMEALLAFGLDLWSRLDLVERAKPAGWSPQGHILSGYAAHVHGLSVTERDLDALIKTISNAVEMDTTSVEIGFDLHYLIRMLNMGQLSS